jgi:nucleotide-binding universal stress UspA family protein
MFKKILIANDGSEGAFKALIDALRLAHSHKAQAHMICVEEIPWMPAGSREEVIGDKEMADRKFAEVVAKAEAEAKRHRVKLNSHIVVGHAVPAIVDFIERDRFDLLVTGFMGHSALYNRVIGSTTDRLVELAPCAVLVVK